MGANNAATFGYDAFGRRKIKTVDGKTTEYLYDRLNPIHEISGSQIANLMPGMELDQFFTRTEAGVTSSFLADRLGNTIALTDSTGAVRTQYTYDPFGTKSAVGATDSNAFQYTGRENDGTGLDYYRARYYSPALQRFVSEDPLGFGAGDPNLYAYAGNNPLLFADATGMGLGDFLSDAYHWAGNTVSSAGSYVWQHRGPIMAGGAVVAWGACAYFTGGACAGVAFAGGIGFISGGLGSSVQGGSFWQGAGAGALGGALIGVFPVGVGGWGVAAAAGLGGLAAFVTNLGGQLAANGLSARKISWCSLGVTSAAGALGGAKGKWLGNAAARSKQTGAETAAGAAGGLLPAPMIDLLAYGVGC